MSAHRILVFTAAAVLVVFAISQLLDTQNQSYSGLQTSRNNTVTRVRPGSPADAAGFIVGDRILKDGGIDVTDTKAFVRRGRAEIGEVRQYVIDRDAQEMALSLTFTGLSNRLKVLSMVGWVTGICFLIFGLWPYLKKQNLHTKLLAAVGLCFALLFIGEPYFSSYIVRKALQALLLPVVIFGFAALLHFMLAFPRTKAFLQRKIALPIVYAPAVLLTLYALFLILVEPDASSVLSTVTNILFGLFLLGYFGLTLVVMIRTFLQATREERGAYGLNVMALCVVIALLLPVLEIAVGIVAPNVVLPGSDFYGLAFILLPLSFAFAVTKTDRASISIPES